VTTAEAILLVGLGLVGVALMCAGYAFNRASVAIAAGIFFLVAALHAYGLSAGPWDAMYAAFWGGILLFIISIMEGITLRPNKGQLTAEELAQDTTETSIEEDTDLDRYNDKLERREERDNRRRSSGRRGSRRTFDNDFARTGRF